MTIINEIIEIVNNEELEDILNIGWIDRDEEIRRFVPLLNTIFLEFKSKCLKIHRKQNTDFEISMKLIDKHEIFNEKSYNEVFKKYEFCTSSLLNMFLYENRIQNFITKIESYSETEEKYISGIVKCIGFEVMNNSYIFLNPLSYNTIEIGKKQEWDQWLRELTDDGPGILLNYNPKQLLLKEWRRLTNG
ncbi:hypothetical protein LPY66_15280 [Dehalobacter sp. DCM]|uniref:hypothetical protein n=1 Tax=Dehalobacter sp. DCM TaxID=2907827 RepID=UPI003081A73B|nr:hypothetical protein LPY66_15280 [Dehalobacter sp. DCM]